MTTIPSLIRRVSGGPFLPFLSRCALLPEGSLLSVFSETSSMSILCIRLKIQGPIDSYLKEKCNARYSFPFSSEMSKWFKKRGDPYRA